MNDPLAGLRPLHLPAPVGWWPPAPGWWLLVVLLLLVIAAAWWHYRRTALRRVALRELQQLSAVQLDDARFAAALNLLLRRVALARFPRRHVAALSGAEWLQFLDTRVSGFSSGAGQVLATAPYRDSAALDRAALLVLARRWIHSACGSRT